MAEEIVKEPPYDTVTLTGLVGLFEIAFEQAWRMMKEILEYNVHSVSSIGSPRTIIKTAYQAGMISDEESWLSALAARNNVVYSYNENVALSIIKESKEMYMNMFSELKKLLRMSDLNEKEKYGNI